MQYNSVTIFLPISRDQNLDKIFATLELLDCDRTKTNLLTVVDGDAELFVKVRNFTEQSKFVQSLCVPFKSKHKLKHFDLLGRRMRIADIHNFAKEHMMQAQYVFGIEDDTIIKLTYLKRLIAAYELYPYAGFVTGVQLGRHGIPHVGAWYADDIYDPQYLHTPLAGKGLAKVDAAGFYCYLTPYELFTGHEYTPFQNNSLGCDVNYGLWLRQQGYDNYIDWDMPTIHRTRRGDISPLTTDVKQVAFTKKEGRWRQTNVAGNYRGTTGTV